MRPPIGLYWNNFVIALVATPLLALTACSDSVSLELQQDELAYNNSIAQLSADQEAGNAGAMSADKHQVKLASTQLRYDRGIISGPNEREHQEKVGHQR